MVSGPYSRDQGLLSLEASTFLRFWALGFQGFATYPKFKVLGFQGLATIKILRSWVFRVSLHIKILRSWVSRVLRHITILRSWVSRVPRQKGRARSKIHQGPRPWTQRTQDLGPFWDLGTSLLRIFDFGAGDNPSQLFELCPLFQLTRVTFDPALPYLCVEVKYFVIC